MHFAKSLLIAIVSLGASVFSAPTQLNTTANASADTWIPFEPCAICGIAMGDCVRHCGGHDYCRGWCKLQMCLNDLDPEGFCRRGCGFDKNCGPSGKV